MGKMLRKLTTGLLAGTLAVTTLVGCGSPNNASKDKEAASETAAPAEKDAKSSNGAQKLVVWGGVPAESGPQKLVDAWNSQNPDTPAEYVRYVNDESGNTKLDTGLLSGEQIDVFFTYSADLLQKRAESGMLEDLRNFKGDEFVNSEISGGMDAVPQINGGLYSMPTAIETIGILLNQKMLDAKGIKIPENWTMAQFMDIAKQLTGEFDGKKVYGTTVLYSELPLPIAETTLGGDWIYKSDTESNFDHPVFKANAMLKEMITNGSALPYEEVVSRKLAAYSHPAFLNGEIAMMPTAAWMLRYVKDLENFPHDFVTTFAPFPRLDENTPNPYAAVLNNHISMNSKSQNKDKAWEFMQFWVKEASKYVEKAPSWNKANQEEVVKLILGENSEKLFDAEAYKKVMLNPELKYSLVTKTTGLAQVMQIYKDETTKFILDATSEEDYYKNLKTKADAAIQKEVK
ncbi:MAG: hypothetical protein K0S71_1189 [Clostridia bacterium]|jgi:multiple sugar transport system substrate-binding protein|nr:hypothetical protein [Clostridia bacterium]